MLSGMKEPYRKGSSESILVSSLAGDIARCRLKRRQRYWWAGLLSFEKPDPEMVEGWSFRAIRIRLAVVARRLLCDERKPLAARLAFRRL